MGETEFRRKFYNCLIVYYNHRSISPMGVNDDEGVQFVKRLLEQEGIFVPHSGVLRDNPMIRAIMELRNPIKFSMTFNCFVVYGEAWDHYKKHQPTKTFRFPLRAETVHKQ